MKYLMFISLIALAPVLAADDAKNEWHATSLSEETIQQIQQVQFNYKKCVVNEMQKTEYGKIESRQATDLIIRQCEPELAKMRKVYTDHDVPEVIADRHLKKMRIDTTRKVLQQVMFAEAARKAGQ
jgi:hypothetical protein